MSNDSNWLEEMAQQLAARTGADIRDVRATMRIEMERLAVAFSVKTIEQANTVLAEVGLRLVRKES